MGEVSSDVKKLLTTTKTIAAATHITAQCAFVTAQNTEALQYLAFINR